MSDPAWPDIDATKLDAARRQLDAAIRLLFACDYALAVHTLAHAAFGVLKGVAEHRGATRVLDRAAEDATRYPKGKYWQDFNRVANFLKHSDKDPSGYLAGVPEEVNEALIFLCCEIYSDLSAILTPEIEGFALWFRSIDFADIEDVEEPFISWVSENQELLHAEDRETLLRIGADLVRRLRAHYHEKAQAHTSMGGHL